MSDKITRVGIVVLLLLLPFLYYEHIWAICLGMYMGFAWSRIFSSSIPVDGEPASTIMPHVD